MSTNAVSYIAPDIATADQAAINTALRITQPQDRSQVQTSVPPTTTKSGDTQSTTNKDFPTRTFNPLSKLSSYTYNISLYMMSPEAVTEFFESGKQNINSLMIKRPAEVLVVAQSAGISQQNQEQRALPLDVYIDDLRLENLIASKITRSFNGLTKLSFAIYEPYGYSFITRMTQAKTVIEKNSKIIQSSGVSNRIPASRHFFVMGFRFYGYNSDGSIANVSNPQNDNPSAIHEQYYPILITKIKTKLDGRLTRYDCEGVSISGSSFGEKYSIIRTNVQINGKTVDDVMTGLMKKLNDDEIASVNAQNKSGQTETGKPNKYSYKIATPKELQNWETSLKSSLMVYANLKETGGSVGGSATANLGKEANAKTQPQIQNRNITFPTGTPVAQAIQKIISESEFMRKGINTLFDKNTQNDNPTANLAGKSSTSPFIWYSLVPVVKPMDWCKQKNDWVYDITYVLQPYVTPFVPGALVDKLPDYPGPHKIYDYWYTGKNSEITNFELELDNNYYLTTFFYHRFSESDTTPNIPLIRSQYVNSDQFNITGESVNSFLNYLLDPKAQAKTKIDILGDPDYLTQEIPSSLTEILKSRYNRDNFTINPNGGQVFIEIRFVEAIDYNYDHRQSKEMVEPGVMKLNEQLRFFFPNPDGVADNKLIFWLTKVDSMFSSGKFTQTLNGVYLSSGLKKQSASDVQRSQSGTPATNAMPDPKPTVGGP